MAKIHVSEREQRPLASAIKKRELELRRMIAEERERADTEGFAELVDNVGDAVDRAFARIQIGVECDRVDGHIAEIRELAAARERMEHGTFGVCVDCGERIDSARLSASPAATRCAGCQNRYERARAIFR